MPGLSSVVPGLLERPNGDTSTRLLQYIALPVAGSVLVTLCAHISIALPFSPVPVTMQTFAVILLGVIFGPVTGAITMLLYLAEGAAGLPVFSPHGLPGLARLLGPSAGYLLSYPLAAAVAGASFHALCGRLAAGTAALAAALLAELPIFVLGSVWLATSLHLNLPTAVHLGVSPFLAGESIKLLAVSLAVAALSRPRIIR